MVFLGFVMAWRFAGSPTLRSPLSANPIIEGVVRFPSEFAITTGSLPSKTGTHEFVVPRSIPIIFPIVWFLSIFFLLLFSVLLCVFPRFLIAWIASRLLFNNDYASTRRCVRCLTLWQNMGDCCPLFMAFLYILSVIGGLRMQAGLCV